jgi:hypothetical protein
MLGVDIAARLGQTEPLNRMTILDRLCRWHLGGASHGRQYTSTRNGIIECRELLPELLRFGGLNHKRHSRW